jgi:hypothetical protein
VNGGQPTVAAANRGPDGIDDHDIAHGREP